MLALLDTNILLLHLNGVEYIHFSPNQVVISSLTILEILQYPGMSEKEDKAARTLIYAFQHVTVDDKIAERAALLSRNRRLDTIDLLIAATALELGLPLITKNVKDFKKIPELKVRSRL